MSKKLSEMKKKKQMLEAKVKEIRETVRYRKSVAFLIENELEKAEIVLAAKAIVEKLSKMAEDLATVEGEDIMPMMDQLRQAYGQHLADDFYDTATSKLRESIECLVASKDTLASSVEKLEGILNGEPVASDMSMDEPQEPEHFEEPEATEHEEASSDEASHDEEPTPAVPFSGRERKTSSESVLTKGSLVETLKSSKNSDKVIAEAFFSQVKAGVSVADAVKIVAEAADIQVADVVEIAKEAVSENVSISPADQAKDAMVAGKIAKQLKNKTQTSSSVSSAVAASAPKMGVKTDHLSNVGDMVKAELKGANRLMKEDGKSALGAFQIKKRDITGSKPMKPALMAPMKEDRELETEGNEFSGALAKARAAGKKEFEVDGKTYKVKESNDKESVGRSKMKEFFYYGDKDQNDAFTRWMNQAKIYSLRAYGEDIKSDHWEEFRPAFDEKQDFEEAVDNRFNVDGIEPDFDKWCKVATYHAKHEFDVDAPEDTKDCKADFEDGFSPKEVAEKWHEKFGA